jgi:DNA-binding IclR family transcriptional regulator
MINSVLKAISILQAFSPAEPRLTLAEIADRLGMPKSTTHNLLATLLSCGFIEKVDGDRYALGTAVVALTQGVRVNVELRDRVAPLLRELADVCRESVYLTALDGDFGLYIYAVESPNRLMARTAVGDRTHLHCTSVGKAMLAYLPPAEVEAIVARVGLPASSERTITRLEDLRQELAAIRSRGFALDNQEHELHTFCVGAPIFDAGGRVIAACSISGADPEIVGRRLAELARRVRETAQEAARRMGFVPARPALVLAPATRTWGSRLPLDAPAAPVAPAGAVIEETAPATAMAAR